MIYILIVLDRYKIKRSLFCNHRFTRFQNISTSTAPVNWANNEMISSIAIY